MKVQVVTSDGFNILSVSKSFWGVTHDKKMYDETRFVAPVGTKKVGDTGYVGTNMTQPVKKPKGKELTKAQKKFNRKLSGIRIKVEQAIGVMKRYRAIHDVFRGKKKSHVFFMKNAAGLVNFALQN